MVDPVPLALTLGKLAIEKGVQIIEDCHVKEILTEKHRAGQYDRVTSAVTSQGDIKCNVFINCTGLVYLFFSIKPFY
jgi:glycine/D-amino acid oxidase-like deaminating enzyme